MVVKTCGVGECKVLGMLEVCPHLSAKGIVALSDQPIRASLLLPCNKFVEFAKTYALRLDLIG